MSKWIDVSTDLPVFGRPVLLATKHGVRFGWLREPSKRNRDWRIQGCWYIPS